MQEYVSDAVILNKESTRDQDARYSFFTKRFGKVVGKATSARKITSKLAGHLEPGTLAKVRFVERGGAQIVDALKREKLAIELPDLHSLHIMIPHGEPDAALWAELVSARFSWVNILRVMGWDPSGAVCETCGKAVASFYIARQEFFCASCASNFRPDELILLNAE